MRLAIPLLQDPLCFEENLVNVLIIEDPVTLRQTIQELSQQINGYPGDFILSNNDVPIELSRFAEILIDPVHPETESKKLAAKYLKCATDAAFDYEAEMAKLLADANALALRISLEMKSPALFDPLENPVDLLRLFGFRLDAEGLDTPELLLEWMLMQRSFFDKRLFIFYGLKCLFSKEELSAFYQNALYEKLDMLLIEPFQKEKPLKEECVTIIDKDLCVIQ